MSSSLAILIHFDSLGFRLFHIHNTDEGKEASCGVDVGLDGGAAAGVFFAEAFLEHLRAVIMELAAGLVELLDALERGGFNGVIIAFADQEIVAHDAAERGERQADARAALG